MSRRSSKASQVKSQDVQPMMEKIQKKDSMKRSETNEINESEIKMGSISNLEQSIQKELENLKNSEIKSQQ